MPSERIDRRLQDILDNIARIRRHTDGLTREGFAANETAIDAVERCLERIAEAARKLGDRFDADYPDLQLPELRQLGSKLRHDYDEIRPALIWRMLERRLGPLEEMARQELERLSRPM